MAEDFEYFVFFYCIYFMAEDFMAEDFEWFWIFEFYGRNFAWQKIFNILHFNICILFFFIVWQKILNHSYSFYTKR